MKQFNYTNANICRVCESNSYLTLLTADENKNILKKLRACADILIVPNDELPKYICIKCIEKLEFSYKFKIQCEYTDQKLREKIFENNKIIESLSDENEIINNIAQKSLKDDSLIVFENECFDFSNVEHLIEIDDEEETEAIEDKKYFEEINDDDDNDDNEDNDYDVYDDDAESTVYDQFVEEGEYRDDEAVRVIVKGQDDRLIGDAIKNSEDDGNEEFLDDEVSAKYIEVEQTDLKQKDVIDAETHLVSDIFECESQITTEHIQEENGETTDADIFNEFIVENREAINKSEYINDIENDCSQKKYIRTEKIDIINIDIKLNETLSSSTPKPKQFICDTCGIDCETFFKLNEHKKTHGNKRYQCSVCYKWFSKRYHLKNHFKIHDTVKRFECNLCNKKYTNQGNLDRHKRVYHQKHKSYFCDKCGKGFSQSAILKLHHNVHIDERNFECNICHKRYKTFDYLKLHYNQHLPKEQRKKKVYPNTKKYIPKLKVCVCSHCGKKSNSVALHKSHMRTHTGEQPFQCNICKKKFSFQQSLKNHVLLHTGGRPFACNVCGIKFRQIGHLQGHKLVHTGEKQHKCMVCEKKFALRGNLTVHMRLHTGEKPYQCNLCSKKYAVINSLKRHRLTHKKQYNNTINRTKVEIQYENDIIITNDNDNRSICVNENEIVSINADDNIVIDNNDYLQENSAIAAFIEEIDGKNTGNILIDTGDRCYEIAMPGENIENVKLDNVGSTLIYRIDSDTNLR